MKRILAPGIVPQGMRNVRPIGRCREQTPVGALERDHPVGEEMGPDKIDFVTDIGGSVVRPLEAIYGVMGWTV